MHVYVCVWFENIVLKCTEILRCSHNLHKSIEY